MAKFQILNRIFSGKNIEARGTQLVIDGQVQGDITLDRSFEIRILDGEIGALSTDRSVTCGQVNGDVHAKGSVTARDVQGDVKAGASVSTKAVGGSIHAGGSVTATSVSGSIAARGSVSTRK